MTPSSPFHPPGNHPLSFVSYANNPGIIGEPSGSRRQTPEPAPSPAGNGDALLQLLQRGTAPHNAGGDGRQSSQHPSAAQQHGIVAPDDASPPWLLDPALASLGPSHPYHQQLLLQQQRQQQQLQQQQGIVNVGDILHSALLKQQPLASAQQQNLHRQFLPQQQSYVNQFAAGQANLGRPQIFQQQPPPDRPHSGGSLFPPVQAPVPAPQGAPPFPSRYPVVHTDQQRSLEQSWQPPQQSRQPAADTVNGGSARAWGLPQSSTQQHQVQHHRQPQSHFYGNGVDLLQLLLSNNGGAQIGSSSSPSLRGSMDAGIDGKPPQKLPSTVVHGPIGPPKRNDTAASSEHEDRLGRLWAAPPAPFDHVSKPGVVLQDDHFGQDSILDRTVMKDKLMHSGDARQPAERPGLDLRLLGLNMPESDPPGFSYPPGIRPILADRSEPKERPYGGAWVGTGKGRITTDRDQTGQSQLHRVIGNQPNSHGRPREDMYLNSLRAADISVGAGGHSDSQDHNLKDWLFENEFSRETGRDPSRGGRRGANSASRADSSRRGGRASTSQWVAVNDRQRDKEAENLQASAAGFRDQLEHVDRGTSMSGPLLMSRDENKLRAEDGALQKPREDMKRRRGQQEWRMKQPMQSASHGLGLSPDAQAVESPPRSSKELDGDDNSADSLLPFRAPSLASQLDHPGLPISSLSGSSPGTALEESLQSLHAGEDLMRENGRRHVVVGENDDELGKEEEEELLREFSYLDMDDQDIAVPENTVLQQVAALRESESELRPTAEPVSSYSQQRVHMRADPQYRPDVENITAKLLSIYEALIPLEEEEKRRRQFLSHLEDLVAKDWPGVRLFLFGSCANAFGVCNSDIDICLSVDDESSKADLVTKMANILRMHNMHNVQALTHARVPIVKFTDPATGISCDICVNNMLAVVNSKLLHDYSKVDIRLRQLAFIVKHWAKRRQVNETYRGTLSSYAYVLMCIHFLQQRKPAILPCLQQGMPATYEVKIGEIECAYYNQVDTLANFGSLNKETLGELVLAFFEYWAFRHDYNRAVISVRTGSILSKEQKDWTRRIGNERHLICIEDPFEITHDLGRVVDRHSIRVLRDEFYRAAKILRHDPNSCVTLFEPFIREK